MGNNPQGVQDNIDQCVQKFKDLRQAGLNVGVGPAVMAGAVYGADAMAAKVGAAVQNAYVMDGLIGAAEALQPVPAQALGVGLINLRADGGYQRAAIRLADHVIKGGGQ